MLPPNMTSKWLQLTSDTPSQAVLDNAALLSMLDDHDLLWGRHRAKHRYFPYVTSSTGIPKPLLRRLIGYPACPKGIFESMEEQIKDYRERHNPQSIWYELEWMTTVPNIVETAFRYMVDLCSKISCSYIWGTDVSDSSDDEGDLPRYKDAFDDLLVGHVSRHYYALKKRPAAWYPGPLIEQLKTATMRWEGRRGMCQCSSPKRNPRWCRFLPKTRAYVRKCHTHCVGVVLANIICKEYLNPDVFETIQNHIMSDEDIKP